MRVAALAAAMKSPSQVALAGGLLLAPGLLAPTSPVLLVSASPVQRLSL
jgi:hypothetical protein